MLIDWFTVIAQIVNFLVLVGLLKYFLYDRILNAMDKREEQIQGRIEEAQSKKEQAEHAQKQYNNKRRDLEERKQEMLEEARKEAENKKRDLIDDARDQAEQAKQRWLSSVEQEKRSFLHELRRTMGKEAISVARKTLKDLADEDLDAQVTEKFIQEIKRLSEEQVEKIKKAADQRSGEITVTTATPIARNQRNTLERELTELLGRDLNVQFKESDELICGAALTIPGHKVSWSMEGHLDSLEGNVNRLIESQSG